MAKQSNWHTYGADMRKQTLAKLIKDEELQRFIAEQPKGNRVNFRNLLAEVLELGYTAGVADARKLTAEVLR